MQNKHFKEAMTRYGLADNSIVDYLYISNTLYLGQPSRRLQVTAILSARTDPCAVVCRLARSSMTSMTSSRDHSLNAGLWQFLQKSVQVANARLRVVSSTGKQEQHLPCSSPPPLRPPRQSDANSQHPAIPFHLKPPTRSHLQPASKTAHGEDPACVCAY